MYCVLGTFIASPRVSAQDEKSSKVEAGVGRETGAAHGVRTT
jgi:hypothetical protein